MPAKRNSTLSATPSYRALVEQLNTSSARRRCHPFDPSIIDWSVPITPAYRYMPRELSMFTGCAAFDRLDPEAQSFLTRWEVTQILRNLGHGEHLLSQGLLMSLWRTSSYDPSWRYALHEVAEECQHMIMFNEWVRLNPDIRTYGVREASYGPPLGLVASVSALIAPEVNWVAILLFEVIGDVITNALSNDRSGQLHPILKQLGRAHRLEEARHVAFAKAWLHARRKTMSSVRVALLQSLAERLAQRLLVVPNFLPLPYNPQVARYLSEDDFKSARATGPSVKRIRAHVHETIDMLATLGLIRRQALADWREKRYLERGVLA